MCGLLVLLTVCSMVCLLCLVVCVVVFAIVIDLDLDVALEWVPMWCSLELLILLRWWMLILICVDVSGLWCWLLLWLLVLQSVLFVFDLT